MKKLLLFFISTVFTLSLSAQCVPSVVHEASVTFSTLPPGAISGLFSVSATKQVYFSMGNLQYQGSTGTWRFAEHQYDIIGNAAGNTTAEGSRSTQSSWIDLFGYGTSGYNSKYPYMTTETNSQYYDGNISGTNYDWGVYNAISNGGNQVGFWRTLTSAEWTYLFNSRTNAASKYAWATVNGRNGLVVLPDSWALPAGCSFTSGMSASNSYTIALWTKMENAGAVFLPAAGWRANVTVNEVGTNGYYISSTKCTTNTERAWSLAFLQGSLTVPATSQYRSGDQVRLVRDAN